MLELEIKWWLVKEKGMILSPIVDLDKESRLMKIIRHFCHHRNNPEIVKLRKTAQSHYANNELEYCEMYEESSPSQ